jgi:hypothetical protein
MITRVQSHKEQKLKIQKVKYRFRNPTVRIFHKLATVTGDVDVDVDVGGKRRWGCGERKEGEESGRPCCRKEGKGEEKQKSCTELSEGTGEW